MVAGPLHRLDKEPAHVVILFRQKDAYHHIPSESPHPSLPSGKPINHPVNEEVMVNIK